MTLTLTPMNLIFEFDLDIPKTYQQTENKRSGQGFEI